MEFFGVTISLLVVGEKGQEVFEGVLHRLAELLRHEAGGTVEEVLGQDRAGLGSSGDQVSPGVSIGAKQLTTLGDPPAKKRGNYVF